MTEVASIFAFEKSQITAFKLDVFRGFHYFLLVGMATPITRVTTLSSDRTTIIPPTLFLYHKSRCFPPGGGSYLFS